MEWLGGLDASFEAGLARDEEIAATDLAFSLRQDADLRQAVARSGSGWVLTLEGGATLPVDEVGADYLRAGETFVPFGKAVLQSSLGPAPSPIDRTLVEVLGTACRAGAEVDVTGHGRSTSGQLTRVARDHLAVTDRGQQTLIGTGAVDAVRIRARGGYSASRGFRG